MKPLQVEVNDGKYTVVIHDNGRLEALRHGESWRWLTGDNLVFCLAAELYEAREKIIRLEGEINEYAYANEISGGDY
jgi:hypothetical protein